MAGARRRHLPGPALTGTPAFPAADEHPLDTCVRLRETAPVVEVEFPGGVPAYLALTTKAVREILAGDNRTFLRDPKHWPALHDGRIPEDWPLRSIVQGAVETEMSVFGTLGVRLTQDIAGTALWVDADPDKLERALAALLDNAAKYSQPGDEVRLVVSGDDESASVAVVDRGLGISAEDQEHLIQVLGAGIIRVDQQRDIVFAFVVPVSHLASLNGSMRERNACLST